MVDRRSGAGDDDSIGTDDDDCDDGWKLGSGEDTAFMIEMPGQKTGTDSEGRRGDKQTSRTSRQRDLVPAAASKPVTRWRAAGGQAQRTPPPLPLR